MTKMIIGFLMVLVLGPPVLGADIKSPHPSGRISTIAGINLGTPAGINFLAGYYNDKGYGFRITGGYLPGRGRDQGGHIGGFQANLLRRLFEGRNSLVDGSIIGGYSEIDAYDDFSVWRYVGVACALKWKFLFGELALTMGTGTYKSPQLGLQIGFTLTAGRKQSR